MNEEYQANEALQNQEHIMLSCQFLPDYLMEEALDTDHITGNEEMQEYRPENYFMEQILHLFPRDFVARMRLMPALSDAVQKQNEAQNVKDGVKWMSFYFLIAVDPISGLLN